MINMTFEIDVELFMLLITIMGLLGGLITFLLKFNSVLTRLAEKVESLEKAFLASNTRLEILETRMSTVITELSVSASEALAEIKLIRSHVQDYQEDMERRVANQEMRLDRQEQFQLQYLKNKRDE